MSCEVLEAAENPIGHYGSWWLLIFGIGVALRPNARAGRRAGAGTGVRGSKSVTKAVNAS